MTAMNSIAPRAFAVWWKDFGYWQVRSLRLALTKKCNWPTVRLGDVTAVRSEVVPDEEIQTGRINLLDRISFDEGKVFFGKRTVTRMVQFRAKPGDIVISKINARKRAIGIVQNGTDVGVTIHFRALIPDTIKIDSEFLWAALRSTFCSQQFEVETGGIGKGEISEASLLEIAVPVPPLAVQKAIVAHWRRAQDEITAARNRVKKREASMDARFFDDLGLKSPDQRSMPEGFAVWWQDFLRWGVGFNYLNQSGADLTRGKYPVAELGKLLELVQYGTSEKANTNTDGVAVIRMNNIVDGQLDLGNLKHLRLSKSEMEKLLLKDGDILFNRTNSKELVGKCAVFHRQGEYVFASYLIRIRADSAKADAQFVAYVINCSIGRQQIDALSRQIIGQANINSVEMRGLQVPLPPLDVQKEIMERVSAGREEIAREREAADRLDRDINAEVEALILGTKKVSEL
jgi:type I restriction enzyme S subunit